MGIQINFEFANWVTRILAPWLLYRSEFHTERAELDTTNQMTGIWRRSDQNLCIRPLFRAFVLEGLAAELFLTTGLPDITPIHCTISPAGLLFYSGNFLGNFYAVIAMITSRSALAYTNSYTNKLHLWYNKYGINRHLPVEHFESSCFVTQS